MAGASQKQSVLATACGRSIAEAGRSIARAWQEHRRSIARAQSIRVTAGIDVLPVLGVGHRVSVDGGRSTPSTGTAPDELTGVEHAKLVDRDLPRVDRIYIPVPQEEPSPGFVLSTMY